MIGGIIPYSKSILLLCIGYISHKYWRGGLELLNRTPPVNWLLLKSLMSVIIMLLYGFTMVILNKFQCCINWALHMCWPLTISKWGMQFISIHWPNTIIFNHESILQYLGFNNNRWIYIYNIILIFSHRPPYMIHQHWKRIWCSFD